MAGEPPRDVLAELTAVKALLVAIVIALANRDRALACEIIDACPAHRAGVDYMDPRVAAVAVALDDILDELRGKIGSD